VHRLLGQLLDLIWEQSGPLLLGIDFAASCLDLILEQSGPLLLGVDFATSYSI
jgi:hypothetical protein